MIGDGIEVSILAVRENVVRLGIAAPHDVSVYRGEVFDALQSRITGGSFGQAGSAVRVKRFAPAASAPASGRRRDPYTGWGVVYTTPDVDNPFVQRVLTELRERYRGLRAFAEYDPREQTVTVDPPEDAEVAEANRVGDEIEGLLTAIYEEMSRYDRE